MRGERRFWNLQPFEFEWYVPKGGFQWVDGKALDSRQGKRQFFLTNRITSGIPMQRPYKPLEDETGLFRQFVDTPSTQEGILQFANKYGLLGGEASVFVEILLSKTKVPVVEFLSLVEGEGEQERRVGSVTVGERLEVWQKAIIDMKRAVEVFDAIQRRDTQYLAQFIHWQDRDLVLYKRKIGDTTYHSIIGRRETDPGRMNRFRYGDVLLPAQYFLQVFVNQHMEVNPSNARLLWDDMSHPSIFVCPHGLLAALWLQLALAIDGDRTYRSCRVCSKWFEVGLTKRRDAKTCSDSCRKKLSRSEAAAKEKGKSK
jgi:hypothetical protein